MSARTLHICCALCNYTAHICKTAIYAQKCEHAGEWGHAHWNCSGTGMLGELARKIMLVQLPHAQWYACAGRPFGAQKCSNGFDWCI